MYDVVVVVYYWVYVYMWVVTEFIATWRNQKGSMTTVGVENRCAQIQYILFSIHRSFSQLE